MFALSLVQVNSVAKVTACASADSNENFNKHLVSAGGDCAMWRDDFDDVQPSDICARLESVRHGNIEIPAIFRYLYP